MPEPPAETPAATATRRPTATQLLRENWGWAAAAVVVLVVLYFLGPILMPFVIGAALAYLGNPVVDRLERLHLTRTGGVVIVFVVVAALVAGIMFLLVPMIGAQITTFIDSLPQWLSWIQDTALPALGLHLPPGIQLNTDAITRLIENNLSGAGSVAREIMSRLGRSTPTLLALIINLLLIPIVAFYLLRDWDGLVARLDVLIPRNVHARVIAVAHETDAVMSALIRGQLLVMVSLAVIYSAGLTIAGLHVALLIGVGAGLVSFIPYLGFVSGIIAAAIAMFMQTHAVLSLLWVGIVFGIGEIMETGVLTPKLVGDRIGLHPVAVIFAVLAGGQLFGFVGVLLALPVAAVLAVLARHARESWINSPVYHGQSRNGP